MDRVGFDMEGEPCLLAEDNLRRFGVVSEQSRHVISEQSGYRQLVVHT
jgi:hypothetical protein